MTERRKLYLIAHSMGGAIAVKYLQQTSDSSAFSAVMLSAPMLEIAFPYPFVDSWVEFLSSWICKSGFQFGQWGCYGFARPDWDRYDPSGRIIDASRPDPANLSHSVARYKFRDFLWNDYNPRLVTAGPTIRWVWQSTKVNEEMRRPENLSKISTPLFILVGSHDISTVNARHQWYCDQLKSQGKICHLLELAGAYHEILFEADKFRDPALLMTRQFFRLSRAHREAGKFEDFLERIKTKSL